MAHAICIGLRPPSAATPTVALGEPTLDFSPASWDVLRELVWCRYQNSIIEGAVRTGPANVGGVWRVQSLRQVACHLGFPVMEVESWGYVTAAYKTVYEGSGNYAKTGVYNSSKWLFGQFVGGEHWSIQTTFDSVAGQIRVPVASSIPGPISLNPPYIGTGPEGSSGNGLFRHEIQTIKGGLAMHRRFYAYHGTYWV